LEEIRFSDINNGEKVNTSVNREKDYKFSKTILWIFLIMIPVLELCISHLPRRTSFGKKSFTNVSVQTSTHRIVKDTTKIVKQEIKVPVTDSLKKDSLVKPVGKGTKPAPAAPKH
jgi:hypothetical protein